MVVLGQVYTIHFGLGTLQIFFSTNKHNNIIQFKKHLHIHVPYFD